MYDGLPQADYGMPHGVSDADLEARFGCPEECEDCAVVENCGDKPEDCRGPFTVDDRMAAMTDVATRPASQLFPLLEWAGACGIGQGKAYEYCRREVDPMPHIKQGVRILVEPDAAIEWVRRRFGVGYETKED